MEIGVHPSLHSDTMAWGRKPGADDLTAKLATGVQSLFVLPFRTFGVWSLCRCAVVCVHLSVCASLRLSRLTWHTFPCCFDRRHRSDGIRSRTLNQRHVAGVFCVWKTHRSGRRPGVRYVSPPFLLRLRVFVVTVRVFCCSAQGPPSPATPPSQLCVSADRALATTAPKPSSTAACCPTPACSAWIWSSKG